MAESVYKIIEVVGTSKTSWEDAAKGAIKAASGSVRDLRIAEVIKLDVVVDADSVVLFRTRLSLSFKYDIPAKAPARAKPKAKAKSK